MGYYREQMEEMLSELKTLLQEYEDEYRDCPDGTLHYCISHGKKRYSLSIKENNRSSRRSINKDPEIINALARKAYLEKAIDEIKRGITGIMEAGKTVSGLDPVQIIKNLPPAYSDLPESAFFDSEKESLRYHLSDEETVRCERHRKWAAKPYEKSDYNPDRLKFLTTTGIKVRSKSEVIIVEENAGFGVPLRYEQVVRLGNHLVVPDFTFQGADGKLFFWEHAGMMDNSYYMERHKEKMELYESFGIVPWKNLIVTYDRDGVVNVPMIKSIIRYEVIPRL